MRKLAHIRSFGHGLRTWDSPTYHTPGVSPSHSVYDVKAHAEAPGNTMFTPYGVFSPTDPLAPSKAGPTITRQARVGAQFSSLAAMPIFQSGWQTNWDHLCVRPVIAETRSLNMNFNRNAVGRAEQQRATVYNPWPSFGALSPKAV